MTGEVEAAGDVLTGGVVAAAVEDKAGASGIRKGDIHGKCLNCGASLTGAFCAACGQAAHTHRSLISLAHDILHGVFHFEGRIWHTVPELFLRPGRLTRRYIDGERAKFVSPMALFLFTVFLTFAVFSITGGALLNQSSTAANNAANVVTDNLNAGAGTPIQVTDENIAKLRSQLDAPDLTPDQRARIESKIADMQLARDGMDAFKRGDWAKLVELEKQQNAKQGKSADAANLNLGWPALERRLSEGMKQVSDNPSLLLYKLKTNGYKFSWALIPLSVPFLWLLFFWRRDINLYDHAIFATYSISFMMLLVILLSIAAAAGVGSDIWGTALFLIPPIHLYRQLRGAYGLSRFGAFVRLLLLLIAITLVLVIFAVLLLMMGVLT